MLTINIHIAKSKVKKLAPLVNELKQGMTKESGEGDSLDQEGPIRDKIQLLNTTGIYVTIMMTLHSQCYGNDCESVSISRVVLLVVLLIYCKMHVLTKWLIRLFPYHTTNEIACDCVGMYDIRVFYIIFFFPSGIVFIIYELLL